MCECGCGEMNLIAAFPVEGTDAVLAIDEYPGCNGCETPMGVTVRLFNVQGLEDWEPCFPVLGEPMKADENGGERGYGWSFPWVGQAELVQAAREDVWLKDLDLSDYDTLADVLADHGLRLLQSALRVRKKAKGDT